MLEWAAASRPANMTTNANDHNFLQYAREVLQQESHSISEMLQGLDQSFVDACELILACRGRVVVTGMGKSGHVGGKIASTLASTGTPAFFVHPGEAGHGDLGMITPTDLVLAISHSGETPEILAILPIIKRMNVKMIALLGENHSTIGHAAEVSLLTHVVAEACPHNLAPTASTTSSMAMGDALAVSLLRHRGFTREDFAKSHPSGMLGKRLLSYARDIMHSGDQIPLVQRESSVRDALLEMNSKGLGMTGVRDQQNRICGIFTDGDLRRAFSHNIDVYECPIHKVMTADPLTLPPDTLAAEIVQFMETNSINGVFIVDGRNQVVGALNTLDLLRAGIY